MINSVYKLSEFVEISIRAWQLRRIDLIETDNIWEEVVTKDQIKEAVIMKLIAVLLMVVGFVSLVMSTVAFGDIGVAILISGIVSLLSGIGFFLASRKV